MAILALYQSYSGDLLNKSLQKFVYILHELTQLNNIMSMKIQAFFFLRSRNVNWGTGLRFVLTFQNCILYSPGPGPSS